MDDAERLQEFRETQAGPKELAAITAECHAEQWRKAAQKYKRPEWTRAAGQRADEARAARVAADKLHELAGTSPADYYALHAKTLRDQAEGLRGELVIMQERADHPDIYGGEPETLSFDLYANSQLVEALLDKAAELEALAEDAAEQEPKHEG